MPATYADLINRGGSRKSSYADLIGQYAAGSAAAQGAPQGSGVSDRGGLSQLSSIGKGLVNPLLSLLDVVDTPRAVVTSALKETIDLFDDSEDASIAQFVTQARDNIGAGDLIADWDANIWAKRGVGFLGEVLLDPFSYIGAPGAGALARGGSKAVAKRVAVDRLVSETVPDEVVGGILTRASGDLTRTADALAPDVLTLRSATRASLDLGARRGDAEAKRLLGALDAGDPEAGVEAALLSVERGWAQEVNEGLYDLARRGGGVGSLRSDDLVDVLIGADASGLRLRPFWRDTGGRQLVGQEKWARWTRPAREARGKVAGTKLGSAVGDRLGSPVKRTLVRLAAQHGSEGDFELSRAYLDAAGRAEAAMAKVEADYQPREAMARAAAATIKPMTRKQKDALEAVMGTPEFWHDDEIFTSSVQQLEAAGHGELPDQMRSLLVDIRSDMVERGMRVGDLMDGYWPLRRLQEQIGESMIDLQGKPSRDLTSVPSRNIPRFAFSQEIPTVARAIADGTIYMDDWGDLTLVHPERMNWARLQQDIENAGRHALGDEWKDMWDRDPATVLMGYLQQKKALVRDLEFSKALVAAGVGDLSVAYEQVDHGLRGFVGGLKRKTEFTGVPPEAHSLAADAADEATEAFGKLSSVVDGMMDAQVTRRNVAEAYTALRETEGEAVRSLAGLRDRLRNAGLDEQADQLDDFLRQWDSWEPEDVAEGAWSDDPVKLEAALRSQPGPNGPWARRVRDFLDSVDDHLSGRSRALAASEAVAQERVSRVTDEAAAALRELAGTLAEPPPVVRRGTRRLGALKGWAARYAARRAELADTRAGLEEERAALSLPERDRARSEDLLAADTRIAALTREIARREADTKNPTAGARVLRMKAAAEIAEELDAELFRLQDFRTAAVETAGGIKGGAIGAKVVAKETGFEEVVALTIPRAGEEPHLWMAPDPTAGEKAAPLFPAARDLFAAARRRNLREPEHKASEAALRSAYEEMGLSAHDAALATGAHPFLGGMKAANRQVKILDKTITEAKNALEQMYLALRRRAESEGRPPAEDATLQDLARRRADLRTVERRFSDARRGYRILARNVYGEREDLLSEAEKLLPRSERDRIQKKVRSERAAAGGLPVPEELGLEGEGAFAEGFSVVGPGVADDRPVVELTSFDDYVDYAERLMAVASDLDETTAVVAALNDDGLKAVIAQYEQLRIDRHGLVVSRSADLPAAEVAEAPTRRRREVMVATPTEAARSGIGAQIVYWGERLRERFGMISRQTAQPVDAPYGHGSSGSYLPGDANIPDVGEADLDTFRRTGSPEAEAFGEREVRTSYWELAHRLMSDEDLSLTDLVAPGPDLPDIAERVERTRRMLVDDEDYQNVLRLEALRRALPDSGSDKLLDNLGGSLRAADEAVQAAGGGPELRAWHPGGITRTEDVLPSPALMRPALDPLSDTYQASLNRLKAAAPPLDESEFATQAVREALTTDLTPEQMETLLPLWTRHARTERRLRSAEQSVTRYWRSIMDGTSKRIDEAEAMLAAKVDEIAELADGRDPAYWSASWRLESAQEEFVIASQRRDAARFAGDDDAWAEEAADVAALAEQLDAARAEVDAFGEGLAGEAVGVRSPEDRLYSRSGPGWGSGAAEPGLRPDEYRRRVAAQFAGTLDADDPLSHIADAARVVGGMVGHFPERAIDVVDDVVRSTDNELLDRIPVFEPVGEPTPPPAVAEARPAAEKLSGVGVVGWEGDESLLDKPIKVAFVGSREISGGQVGREREAVRRMIEEFGDDFVVVSGLAQGADVAAQHEAILEGAGTISVLGGSLRSPLPSSGGRDQQLRDLVRSSDRALTVTRHAEGRATRDRLMGRNGVIAGLSDLFVVAAYKQRSGTSNGVRQALDQGKTVAFLRGAASDADLADARRMAESRPGKIIESAEVMDFLRALRPAAPEAPAAVAAPVRAAAGSVGLDRARKVFKRQAAAWRQRSRNWGDRAADVNEAISTLTEAGRRMAAAGGPEDQVALFMAQMDAFDARFRSLGALLRADLEDEVAAVVDAALNSVNITPGMPFDEFRAQWEAALAETLPQVDADRIGQLMRRLNGMSEAQAKPERRIKANMAQYAQVRGVKDMMAGRGTAHAARAADILRGPDAETLSRAQAWARERWERRLRPRDSARLSVPGREGEGYDFGPSTGSGWDDLTEEMESGFGLVPPFDERPARGEFMAWLHGLSDDLDWAEDFTDAQKAYRRERLAAGEGFEQDSLGEWTWEAAPHPSGEVGRWEVVIRRNGAPYTTLTHDRQGRRLASEEAADVAARHLLARNQDRAARPAPDALLSASEAAARSGDDLLLAETAALDESAQPLRDRIADLDNAIEEAKAAEDEAAAKLAAVETKMEEAARPGSPEGEVYDRARAELGALADIAATAAARVEKNLAVAPAELAELRIELERLAPDSAAAELVGRQIELREAALAATRERADFMAAHPGDMGKAKAMMDAFADTLVAEAEIVRLTGDTGVLKLSEQPPAEAGRMFDAAMRRWGTHTIEMAKNDNHVRYLVREHGRQLRAWNSLMADSEVADALDTLSNARRFSEFGNWLEKVTGFWRGIATLSVGFHVRNFISGMVNNFNAGVTLSETAEFLPEYLRYMRREAAGNQKVRDYIEWSVGEGVIGRGLYVTDVKAVTREGRSANPLAGLSDPSRQWAPVAWSREVGGHVEDAMRALLGWHTINKLDAGASPLSRKVAAQQAITKWQFDYGDLSNFDRMAKNVVPFWTFLSRNMMLQYELLATRPQLTLTLERLFENIGDGHPENPFVPSYFETARRVQIGERTFLTLDLSFGSAASSSYLGTPRGFMAGTPEIGGSMSPLLRSPIEVWTQRDLYRGRELNRIELAERVVDGVFPLYERTKRLLPQPIATPAQAERRLTSVGGWLGVPVAQVSDAQMRQVYRSGEWRPEVPLDPASKQRLDMNTAKRDATTDAAVDAFLRGNRSRSASSRPEASASSFSEFVSLVADSAGLTTPAAAARQVSEQLAPEAESAGVDLSSMNRVVTWVADGDTFRIQDYPELVRIAGIDAPECTPDCESDPATLALKELIAPSMLVNIVARPDMDYDRTRLVADVLRAADDLNIGQELMERGLVERWEPAAA